MKKIFLSLVVLALLTADESIAQRRQPAAVAGLIGNEGGQNDKKNSNSNELRIVNAEKVMDMEIPEGGANGAAVVYHPQEKLYYAAQAGNMQFPLVIFNANGKVVSEDEQQTLIDVRGLWYNPKTKKLEGNAYNEYGWFSYELNSNGQPTRVVNKKEGMYQPDQNSAGVLNTDDHEVLFLNALNIACYTVDGVDKRKNIKLNFGATSTSDAVDVSVESFEETYNVRSMAYTGIKGAEIGLLNVVKKQVELYNIKTGYMSQVIKLPIEFDVERFFNFSYANGIYWVFDKQKRKWNGYK